MDKFDWHLERIKKSYPTKIILNQQQYCRVIGISTTKFNSLILKNELHKLPPFKVKIVERKNGYPYRTYSFDIYDVAKHLSQN
ncbi:hypothetical protein [Aliarcobacter butzleri]|uniref:hypothetical protein n=1 Tax=Aliarcobacter butzleri TaxID=28197 RepID=UPI003AF923A0